MKNRILRRRQPLFHISGPFLWCDPNSLLLTSGASGFTPTPDCYHPNHKELPAGARPGLKGIIALWGGEGGVQLCLSDAEASHSQSAAVYCQHTVTELLIQPRLNGLMASIHF